MIVPNKFITYEQSAIAKAPRLLEKLTKPCNITEFYKSNKRSFQSVRDFIYVLDTLYVLNQIKLDESNGEISRVD